MSGPAWDEVLRAHGHRVTTPRRLVLEAVQRLGHATPDAILADVQSREPGVNLSTVYRNLDVLEEVRLVTHAHLGHGAPTYHPVGVDSHIHLVCDGCGDVLSVDAESARTFVDRLRDDMGFHADVTHVSVHGRCARCWG